MRQEVTSGTFTIEHLPSGEVRLTLRPLTPVVGTPPSIPEGTVVPGTIDIYIGEGQAVPTIEVDPAVSNLTVLNESGGQVGWRANNTATGDILIKVPDGVMCRAKTLKSKVTCQVWAHVWRWVWDNGGPFGLPGRYEFKPVHERVQADKVLYDSISGDATTGGTGLKVGHDGRIV